MREHEDYVEDYDDDEDAEQACEIADDVALWCECHKEHCDDPTCTEPLNLLAFLAHCNGVRYHLGVGAEFERLLRDYEDECEGCQHERN